MYQALWIVLLFDDETEQLVINRNTSLETEHQPIDLWTWAIPHMTLAQVLMDEAQKESMIQWIEWLDISNIDIPTDGIHVMTSDVGNQYTWWNVLVPDVLQSLHTSVMDKLVWFGCYNNTAQAEHYLCTDRVSAWAIERLQYFDQRHAYENYNPHITVGLGVNETPELPVYIQPKSLAIWRLWANGTVREIAYEKVL